MSRDVNEWRVAGPWRIVKERRPAPRHPRLGFVGLNKMALIADDFTRRMTTGTGTTHVTVSACIQFFCGHRKGAFIRVLQST